MMDIDYPEVDVKELGIGEALDYIQNNKRIVTNLMEISMERQEKQYLLFWEDNKVPRGAIINGHEISWTQHGTMRNTNGEMVAVYQRLSEFAGNSGKEQVLLVSMLGSKEQ